MFDVFMTDYIHFSSVRKLKKNARRNNGGISVFIRNEIASKFNVQRLYSHYKDCIVLRLNGAIFDDNKDILLYFTYISPEGSPVYTEEKNGIKLMQANISIMKDDYPDAHYFIGGDLNACTKDFLDYIPFDNLFYIFGETDYEGDIFNLERKNRDSLKFNLFGKTLTDFCRIFDLHIMNGRLYDDVDGNFTCAANDGASTVDYNIRMESDHFPIFCQFTFDIVLNQSTVNTRNYLMTHDQIKYKWIPEKSENFILAFCDLLTINKDFSVQTCINNIDSGINKLNDIFYRAAFSMKGRGRSRYSRTQTQPSWWDDECDRLKKTKYAALRKFRLTYNQGDLQNYKDSRNSF